MQCLQRVRESTTTCRVWTCWPEADATWASVCNWTAVTPPCCWEQEQEELEMCQEGNVWFKTWDYLTSYRRGRESSFNSPTLQRTFKLYRFPTLKLVCWRLAGSKVISPLSPKWTSKHTPMTQNIKRVVMINMKTFNTVLPSRNRHLVLLPKSYFNVPFISSNELTRTKVLTTLKLQWRILGLKCNYQKGRTKQSLWTKIIFMRSMLLCTKTKINSIQLDYLMSNIFNDST